MIIMKLEFLVLNYFLDTLVKSAALVFCEELNGAGMIGQIRPHGLEENFSFINKAKRFS